MPTTNQSQSRVHSVHFQSHWRQSLMSIMQSVNEKDTSETINIGRRLQELRTMRGLSIRLLADLSGLNFNTLSLIENEKSSPNVNTLQQLATALQVPITAFFETSSFHNDIVFQKNGARPKRMFPHGLLEDLGGGLALGEATPLLITANANSNSGNDAIVHTGQEFVYCLEGTLVYHVGTDEYILAIGDSLIFQAYIPHRWENRSELLAKAILVICPSDNRDRSVGQHLQHDANLK